MDSNDNIKYILEQITGSELGLKRNRATEAGINQKLFENIIIAVEKVNNRTLLMETEFDISHYKYDEPFIEIIEALFYLSFGRDATNLIMHYIYDRLNPDGTMNELLDENNEPIALNTPADLWACIMAMEGMDTKKKKKK